MKAYWKDGIWGLIIGDALGVPVEYSPRYKLVENPVTGMREYGSHRQPIGTWSDDSSMTLATLSSIKEKRKLDYGDIMERFVEWCLHDAYTANRDAFDIDRITAKAIVKYQRGIEQHQMFKAESCNDSNGSLVRILPICLFLYEKQKKELFSIHDVICEIHNASLLTHANKRSQIACGIYYFLVKAIIEEHDSIEQVLEYGFDNAYKFYLQDADFHKDLEFFDRLLYMSGLKCLSESRIGSSCCVVDTIEATVWCLLNTTSFSDAVLKAVNLGNDTDTIGAITGSLAGLYYGYSSIPKEWLDVIQRKAWIDNLLL